MGNVHVSTLDTVDQYFPLPSVSSLDSGIVFCGDIIDDVSYVLSLMILINKVHLHCMQILCYLSFTPMPLLSSTR